ncbi:MAG: sensor domain CHASE-containing protein [Alphaproteobacteria bacterium]|jgi:sensor domain CHASE-containing protein
MFALERMADRWTVRGGTPYKESKKDAENYTNDQPGLTTVEWVDASYHIRWLEPLNGNEKALGLDILFNDKRKQALKHAKESTLPTVTPPLDLVQGYKGYLAYFPVYRDTEFDGFIVGVFNLGEVLKGAMPARYKNDFYLKVYSEDNSLLYESDNITTEKNKQFQIEKKIRFYGQGWTLRLMPRNVFVDGHQTF